jgi:hypothetical protein
MFTSCIICITPYTRLSNTLSIILNFYLFGVFYKNSKEDKMQLKNQKLQIRKPSDFGGF